MQVLLDQKVRSRFWSKRTVHGKIPGLNLSNKAKLWKKSVGSVPGLGFQDLAEENSPRRLANTWLNFQFLFSLCFWKENNHCPNSTVIQEEKVYCCSD